MLHQLECALALPGQQEQRSVRVSSAAKMKNYMGTQALVISNKQ